VQDGWANIWDAVLAVSLPAENCVFVWLCPEVLLSLLLEKSDYTKTAADALAFTLKLHRT
jgi:hypothetical protein